MRNRRTRSAGFTLIELAVVVALVGLAVIACLVYAGRFFVEDVDAVREARRLGYEDARVVERHNFFAGWRGCEGGDAVAFELEATDADGNASSVTVCCRAWFRGCTGRVPSATTPPPATPPDAGITDAGR